MQDTTDDNVERGTQLLDDALKLSPDYAPGWAELGLAHLKRAELAIAAKDKKADYEQGRAALEKALRLDPSLAQAHSRMAGVQWQVDWDFSAAQRSTEQAMASDPKSTIVLANAAYLDSILGRIDSAIALMEQLVERDPLSIANYRNLAGYYTTAERLDDAEALARRGLALEPDSPMLLLNMGGILLKQGRIAEASAAWDRCVKLLGDDPSWRLYFDSIVSHYSGNIKERDALMDQYEGKFCSSEPSTCASFYALRQSPDETFAWLEKSYDLREPGLPAIKYEPEFAFLHDDPRWEPFWLKVGFRPGS